MQFTYQQSQLRLASSSPAEEQSRERAPEVPGTESVDERIDGRVAISEPEEQGEDFLGRAVVAEGAQQVDGEEGGPAEDEAADYYSDRLGGLLFTVQTTQLRSNLHSWILAALVHAVAAARCVLTVSSRSALCRRRPW